MSKSPPPSSRQPPTHKTGEDRLEADAPSAEPLVVLPPTLVPLDPKDERRAVELLAELLAGLLEQPSSTKGRRTPNAG